MQSFFTCHFFCISHKLRWDLLSDNIVKMATMWIFIMVDYAILSSRMLHCFGFGCQGFFIYCIFLTEQNNQFSVKRKQKSSNWSKNYLLWWHEAKSLVASQLFCSERSQLFEHPGYVKAKNTNTNIKFI